MEALLPGIARVRLGQPEAGTPVSLRQRAPQSQSLRALSPPPAPPLDLESIGWQQNARGFSLEIPLQDDEEIYGLGLQLQSFRQRKSGAAGSKKTLRVNADAKVDTGDSHAPVPFYVSTRGYGILIDTARYATFYLGCAQRVGSGILAQTQASAARSAGELYASLSAASAEQWHVEVEIPAAQGADVYLFWGENLLQAVQRYNLFSGGGCLPPRWGLGVWYRARTDASQNDVLEMARLLRASQIPCDVLGLEPGWHSHAYPCTYQWSEQFPAPAAMMDELKAAHFQVNLWEHAFVHRDAPFAAAIAPLAGDHAAFGGLVPDFSLAQTRELFIEHHSKTHLSLGVAGYKLDECDNSDFIGWSWSFPETTRFASGLDGEQMHSLLGVLYQATIEDIFVWQNRATYGLVRASGALAAPFPFALYSDLYDHREFLRGVCNAGFCGLLWTPEVREARDAEDLVRRLQSVICSPVALVNAWYIKHPPWRQWEIEANNADQLAADWPAAEALCRQILELRMMLIPYLHAAFGRYQSEGVPPFRALVMDFPDEEAAREVDDQWMMGDRLLVAPMIAGQTMRSVYLPPGDWRCFWSGDSYAGARTIEVSHDLRSFPLFVRDDCVLPLATPTLHTQGARSCEITAHVYGNGALACALLENNGTLELKWDVATRSGTIERDGVATVAGAPFYRVENWEIC